MERHASDQVKKEQDDVSAKENGKKMPPPPPRTTGTSISQTGAPVVSYHTDSQATRYHDRGIASDGHLQSEPSVNKNAIASGATASQQGGARSMAASTGQVAGENHHAAASAVGIQQGSSLGGTGYVARRTISIEGSTGGPNVANVHSTEDQKDDFAVTSTLSTRVDSWGEAVQGTAAAALSNIGTFDASVVACSAISSANPHEIDDRSPNSKDTSKRKNDFDFQEKIRGKPDRRLENGKPTKTQKISSSLPEDFFQQQQSAVGRSVIESKLDDKKDEEFAAFMAEVDEIDNSKQSKKIGRISMEENADDGVMNDEQWEEDRAEREDFEHL